MKINVVFCFRQVTYANHAQVLASHTPPQRNMRELDTLLDDLNRSRYSGGSVGGPNSSGGNSNDGRPSVDSLLNELSNAVHKYTLPVSIFQSDSIDLASSVGQLSSPIVPYFLVW